LLMRRRWAGPSRPARPTSRRQAMRTLSRTMIRAAALVAAAAPALATTFAHTGPMTRVGHVVSYPPFITRIPTYVLTPGTGGGTGAYRLPSKGGGSATLDLFCEAGRV